MRFRSLKKLENSTKNPIEKLKVIKKKNIN